MYQRETRWLLEEKYGGVRSADFLRDCERLAEGEPVDYVIGWSEFLGCRIDLSERPLIPRPETEWWVEKIVKSAKSNAQSTRRELRVLDVFAGSGCIGLAVLKHIRNAYVDFVDIDPACLRQIRKNAELNDIPQKRYRTLQSDVFSGTTDLYDVVFANPPYVAEETALTRLSPLVLKFEPHRALFAGSDGLLYIRAVLRDASRFLLPDGFLAMEFDDAQADDVRNLLDRSRLHGELHLDQYGRSRYLVASY